ncbi:MAG: hypothetical protein NVS4B3_23450 [Gemmatimonadaceae bacterium]
MRIRPILRRCNFQPHTPPYFPPAVQIASAKRGRGLPAVRQRTVQADLALLRAMFRWATTVSTPDGGRWLDRNPLDGLRIAGEKNPK